jgi:hypothetical protein
VSQVMPPEELQSLVQQQINTIFLEALSSTISKKILQAIQESSASQMKDRLHIYPAAGLIHSVI